MKPRLPNLDQLKKDRWVRFRITAVAGLLVMGFTGITCRLLWLQVRQHERLATLAAQVRQLHQRLPAHRGSIRDRNGELLAHDQTIHELYLDQFHLREQHLISRKLAAIRGTTVAQIRKSMSAEEMFSEYRQHVAHVLAGPLGMPAESVLVMLQSDKPEVILCKGLEDEQTEAWRTLLDREQITGIHLRPGVKRAYPAKDRLTHVLGDVDYANQGAWGVEALMNAALAGTDGEQWIERDNKGRELPQYRGAVIEPRNGRDVCLTIDMHLQEWVEAVLMQQCKLYAPRKAIIVVTEPGTGSILAMASRPHYERDARTGMWRNLAISDPYEPGSTFKIVSICAALDSGKVNPNTEIFCHQGYYEEPALRVRLRDDESFGALRVEDVLVHSSNIGAYKIAKQVGSSRFLDYARRFGFGQRTGIGLKGEKAGYLNTDHWTGTTFSRMAMGYEVSVTPLQLAMAIGAVANGGVLMKPRIVDRIVSADGGPVELTQPQAVHQVCKPRTADQLKRALMRVVTDGTGKKAAIEGVSVAGKTGTSQRYDEDLKRYVEGQYTISFVGFAPADDPQVACVVVLDDPKAPRTELYGGKVAAPIFAEVVREALDHLAVNGRRPLKVRLADKGGAQR